MGIRRRRTHSREFKVEAVRMVLVDDRTPKDVGAEIGVHPGLVSRWVKQLGDDPSDAFPGKGHRKSKDQEIYELKRELEQTRQERTRENQALALHIRAIHRETDQTYGTPRITDELRESGILCGRNRVARIKRSLGLFAIATPKAYRLRSTRASSDSRPVPDLVKRNFTAERPNKTWVSDITFIPVQNGHVYLCTILDLFSRRVVGWAIGASNNTDLAIAALEIACRSRQPVEGTTFHSDRGAQYTSDKLRKKLTENGMNPSVGRTGDCYDNAVAEAFLLIAQNGAR